MPSISYTYALNSSVWIVDATIYNLFHGTIADIKLSNYLDINCDIITTILYCILLDNGLVYFEATEDYMRVLEADALILLESLV